MIGCEVERAQLWAQRRRPLVPEPSLAPAPGALQTRAGPLLSEPALRTPWFSRLQSKRPRPPTDPFSGPAGSPGVACGVPAPRAPLPSHGSPLAPQAVIAPRQFSPSRCWFRSRERLTRFPHIRFSFQRANLARRGRFRVFLRRLLPSAFSSQGEASVRLILGGCPQ